MSSQDGNSNTIFPSTKRPMSSYIRSKRPATSPNKIKTSKRQKTRPNFLVPSTKRTESNYIRSKRKITRETQMSNSPNKIRTSKRPKTRPNFLVPRPVSSKPRPVIRIRNVVLDDVKKYVSKICALSYLRNTGIRTKGQFYAKKVADDIYSLVNQYFINTTTFTRSKQHKTITITNYEDLFMFLYSQYIDVLHDTKKNLEGEEFESFNNYLTMVIGPSISGKITKNWIREVLEYNMFEKIKKSTMEHDYFDIVTKRYEVSRTMQVQDRITTNRSKYIVFDQSNSNVGRIFANRFKIVLPIASLADAGMFKNPECKFWRELRDYIDENYVDPQLYKTRFNELLDMYIKKHYYKSNAIKSAGENFINTWTKKTEYSVGDAFRIFKLRYKLKNIGYTNNSQIKSIKIKNTGRVEPCFDNFHFTVKFKHVDENDFTLLDVNYGVNQTDIPGRFESMISKKDLQSQISSLETLFTHGLYNITINGVKAGIKSKSDAYDFGINNNLTGKPLYIKLMEKHVGDLGPQIWALTNRVYYSTGDISGVCQYLVMSHLFERQGEKVYGAFFETGNRVQYLHNTQTRVNVRQPTRKTTTNQIINNLRTLIYQKTGSNQVTPGNLLYILKKTRNKTLNASQSPQRQGATPNRSVSRS